MEDYFRKTHYQSDEVTATYDETRFGDKNRAHSEATEKCLSILLDRLQGTRNVLDMPCGTGRFVDLVKDSGLAYVGADISMEMMSVLVGKHGRPLEGTSLVLCDAARLPFRDDSFDCVLCFKFISLVPKEVRLAILPEIARVTSRYLIAQSKYFRTFSPSRFLKLLLARLLRIRSRIEKYAERASLTKTVEGTGFQFIGRELIRPGLFSRRWPFDREYLAVFTKKGRESSQSQ